MQFNCLKYANQTMRNYFLLCTLFIALTISAQKNDSVDSDTIIPGHSFQLGKHKWTLGFEFEGTITYRRLKDSKHKELVDCRNEHDKPTTGIQCGLMVRREISKNLELVSGISFFQTGFEFSEGKKLSDTLDMEFMIGCEIGFIVDPQYGYVGSGFWDPRYSYIVYGLHPDTATLNIKLEHNYIEVPLLLKGNFGKRRTRGCFAMGGGVNYMVGMKQSVTLTNDEGYSNHYVTTEMPDYYRRWNYSVLTAIGIESKVRENLSAGFHLSGRYQLRSIFGHEYYADYKENHFNFSVGAGIYYHFGKSNR